MQTRIRWRVSAGAVLPTGLASFALAGCSTSLNDPTGLVKQLYRESTGVTVSSATCPTDIPIAKGHQFTCTVQARGTSHTVTLMEMTATASGSQVRIIAVN
jgi:hypothetical protein